MRVKGEVNKSVTGEVNKHVTGEVIYNKTVPSYMACMDTRIYVFFYYHKECYIIDFILLLK